VRRLLVLLIALALLVPASARAAPNVVVVETDDETTGDMVAMPETQRLIGDAGVTFANSFVSLSQCCPSRATFLTGQYAHNHDVLGLYPPFGGYRRLRGSETLPVWLQRAGYATGVIGKYLNGYGDDDAYDVPPGWTEFHGLESSSTYSFYGYTFNDNGVLHHFGHDLRDFQTNVMTDRALSFIRRRAPSPRPFFLWLTYVAPHTGSPRDFADPPGFISAVAGPGDEDAFLGVPAPRTPSFDEADVSDKPRGVRDLPPISPAEAELIDDAHRQRLASLISVDEGVGRIVRALKAAGELDDTLLIFTSDNGYLEGQHRIPFGKVYPYEPSIRVPLLMRGPGLPRGVTRRRLAWNGDLAPTILAAAHARPAFPLDGESLLRPDHGDRAIVLEGPAGRLTDGLLHFVGIRTGRYVDIHHLRGEAELYDLRRDPDELDNLARRPAAAALRARLDRRLDALRGCSGAACRR
jgi:N-acetylglucosamine-6-sulfatase